jgi:hypothetical protein
MPWPLYPQERGMVPNVQGAGCSPQPACKGAENLTPTEIWPPDSPARGKLHTSQFYIMEMNQAVNFIGRFKIHVYLC